MAMKNITWDSVVEVKNGSFRVVEGWKKPVIIWKSENEYLTRFVWLAMNADDKAGHVSKIYQTDWHTWGFAVVSDYTTKLDNTVDLLVWSMGLKGPKEPYYPWVYVLKPTNYMLRTYFNRKVNLRKYDKIDFILSKKAGLEAYCFRKDSTIIDQWSMVSYKKYMEFAKKSGRYFQSIIGSIDTLKDGVAPELWDYMMF